MLRQAREAARRIESGQPLSVLDGVPVAVKDEVDVTPCPTTVGTAFLGASPAKRDAAVVARMRSAGAVLLGKANMHEIGIGVTDLNPHHGTPRNPYNPAHHTGGSSSSSAAAVAAEMSQALERAYAAHRREHRLDVRASLALARHFTARDYVKAQRIRTRMMHHFHLVLRGVDAIITPTTAVPAPAIQTAALPHGESDLSTLTDTMRFVTPANMTGLPTVSFPAGYTDAGLPIGMQAIGRAWHETILLRLALAAEHIVERHPPRIHHRIRTV